MICDENEKYGMSRWIDSERQNTIYHLTRRSKIINPNNKAKNVIKYISQSGPR